jgi:hypothetical protein
MARRIAHKFGNERHTDERNRCCIEVKPCCRTGSQSHPRRVPLGRIDSSSCANGWGNWGNAWAVRNFVADTLKLSAKAFSQLCICAIRETPLRIRVPLTTPSLLWRGTRAGVGGKDEQSLCWLSQPLNRASDITELDQLAPSRTNPAERRDHRRRRARP